MSVKWLVLSVILFQLFAAPVVMACKCTRTIIFRKADPPSPPNVVVEPAYVHSKKVKEEKADEEPPPAKLQYEPATSEMPLLIEQKASHEQGRGAEYEEGTDTFVMPKSPEAIKNEAIAEPEPSSQPEPLEDQSMSSFAHAPSHQE